LGFGKLSLRAVLHLYGFAKAEAQTTLPAKVPANIKNI